MKHLFNSSTGKKLTPDRVAKEIIGFINDDNNCHYKIIIGTDSEASADKTADFVTAIVVYRVGRGGRYFWRRIDENKKFHTLRERMWEEALISLDMAKKFIVTLQKNSNDELSLAVGSDVKQQLVSKLADRVDFEIHVDVGENGATKAMIQELVGMVRANNFGVKTKPESYAASKVADKHV
ncbi:MAG: ribonuclease H-like YkuK family protein [bacterium]|nr:ribonuclease H-like YkuK family protein [bacterium]